MVERPTVRLAEGVFIDDFPGYSLLIRRVVGTTNEMRGVTLFEFGSNPSPNIIVAERGTLSYLPDGDTALLELHDGVVQSLSVAHLALELDRRDESKEALQKALENARAIVSRSLDELRRQGVPLQDLIRDSAPG